jgi:hypothetical protein
MLSRNACGESELVLAVLAELYSRVLLGPRSVRILE